MGLNIISRFKRFFTKTKKKRSEDNIEMMEIPKNKQLGRKTLKKSRVPIYRMRVKKSVCRRKKREECNNNATCKYVSGPLRKFCRKKKNLKIY
jgi:hypothetical protein